MTKFALYVSIFSLAIFSSCSQTEIDDQVLPGFEEAEVTSLNEFNNDSNTEGKVGFSINNFNSQVYEKEALLLTNKSKNATSYYWDFGNGDTSTEANPNYTYDRHGIFAIKLVITDIHDNILEETHNISVTCLFDGGDHDNN